MLTIIQKEKILSLYDEGKSINFIAKEVGISWDTAKRYLKKEKGELIPAINQFSGRDTKRISDDLFSIVADSETAYWLGFLYADGSIRSERNEISFELKEEDKEIVEHFHRFCNNPNKVREHIIKRDGKEYVSYGSHFSSARVKENLIKLGCVPKKSLILTCPTTEQVPNEFFLDFLRGYIDGDGFIQFDVKQYRYRIIILGTENMLNGILKRLGYSDHCNVRMTKTQIFSLEIGLKEQVYSLLQKLYDNDKIALPRKKKIFLQAKELGALTSDCQVNDT